ncbi:hypothetical protein ACIQKE_13455 [Streptomyces griseoviridis]|uniref:DUF8175 domain-containing protein n=2 Tax=Streptomyces TaxID=1883 RepID=A0A3Q9KUT1_STRGD|nr:MULTISPECIES: hypothetical protein [Streptomyces]AZS86474.1 hypothetical protein ELQ87_21135 [Streptomyces griseoviridis]MDH6700090.1 hypothetical protein [Streptomyces sp. MAA16]MDT0470831.1 hypothetical protein [Streptomyces sp. DSM 41014]QCN86662.1 hypothetical protein DDJ31_18140 [Streptomyces griseoviridis]
MFGTRRRRPQETGPFYKQSRWVQSALFMAFLVVMALVATVSKDGSKEVAADSARTLAGVRGPLSPGDPQHVRTGPGGRPVNCRTDDQDTAVPTVAPRDVRWRQLGTVMLPVSPKAGPLNLDPAMWWCYAHTPLGAVLAAHTVPVGTSGADWRTVTEQQVVPGAARDKFVTRKAAAPTTDPDTSSAGRFAGFSVESYAAGRATVGLLLTNPLGGYLSTSVSLRWRDGDWKVALQDDGSLYSAASQAQPNGFVMWGSVTR